MAMDLNVSVELCLGTTEDGTEYGSGWCAYHRLCMQGDAEAVLDRRPQSATCVEAEDTESVHVVSIDP